MPKVMRIINRFNLGGPTYNVAYLSKYLDPEFETMLVGGLKDKTEDSSEFIVDQLGLSPVVIPDMKREINFQRDKAAFREIKKLMRQFKPDIVHTHASKAGTLGRLAASQLKVPVILHTFHGHVFHSYFGPVKTKFYKGVERYLANKSTRIIAISDIQKKELVDIHGICPADKVAVVPLGFDLDRFQVDKVAKRKEFRAAYNIGEDEIAIGIIGRLVPIKNHRLFLQAIRKIQDETTKKVRAYIIGDGESRQEIEQMAKDLQLNYTTEMNPQVVKPLTFTSWIRQVDWVYHGLDLVALTSFNEGTPVSLIEAQACNKPVVSTNVGGIGNVVMENKTALLADVSDIDGFSNHLLRLVEDDKLRHEMGQAGWEHVKERYHYSRLVEDVRGLYRQLLKENGR